MGFAAFDETPVERLERGVPAKGSRQRGGVERAPEPASAAGDVRLAGPAAALLDEGGEAGECCGLLAAEGSELWHAQDQGEGGAPIPGTLKLFFQNNFLRFLGPMHLPW
jgi:hypothetical protein